MRRDRPASLFDLMSLCDAGAFSPRFVGTCFLFLLFLTRAPLDSLTIQGVLNNLVAGTALLTAIRNMRQFGIPTTQRPIQASLPSLISLPCSMSCVS
jgi:hypothetical protein